MRAAPPAHHHPDEWQGKLGPRSSQCRAQPDRDRRRCTLDGGESLVWMGASGIGLQAWYDGMRSLPAVATYLSERPQPATGEVGAKGSIIAEHREPWRRHDK